MVFALAGCAGTGAGPRDIALPPLFSQQKGVGETQERDVAFPFYHEHESDDEEGWGVRPLFYTRTSKSEYKRETTYLWPLGRYSTKPGEFEVRLTPFFYYKSRAKDDGTVDRDWQFLLLFGGKDDGKEGDYLALLPFFGSVKGLLVKERIDFFLFPLYMGTEDYGYDGWNVLFPFFGYAKGNGKEALNILPFYAMKKKEGRYDRRSYLWPFIHAAWENLNTDDPIHSFAVLPLYGQDISVSKRKVARTFLWPFFNYRINENEAGEAEYTEYNLPWPFFRYLRSEKLDHTRFWPLYSRHEDKVKKLTSYQFLFPFGWLQYQDEREYEKRSVWALPFFWDHLKTFKDTQDEEDRASERYTKLWPLFHRFRGRDGTVEHAVLSPWWFTDFEPYGFRDNYDPLLTLYYHRSTPGGESLTSVLGPLIRFYSNGTRETRNRVLFFEYTRRGSGERALTEYELFEGLVGYANDAGEKSLQLLWLPWKIRWGTGR